MSLDHDLVGSPSEPVTARWSDTETLLYALSLGYGHDDQLVDLRYTSENTAGVEQVVVPTYGVIMASGAGRGRSLGDFDRALLVHAEQGLQIHRPIPAAGEAQVTSTVIGMYDKGKAAIVTTEARAVDARTGEPLVTSTSSVFIRGEGGFGGEAGPRSDWQRPDREPDFTASTTTWPGQALLYRLNGDRNPLHADPEFAARGGFGKPILHGLCTYGISARLLLGLEGAGEPAEMREFNARFSSPVIPGDTLTLHAWDVGDGGFAFQTTGSGGRVVLDHGVSRFGSDPA
ncbi:MaoC family dehydratase [Cumulibacter manganitolerans]|uniref:MaoC family dehydratase n=1 Tax=Cumulibacter manganitolerans TaxID=1884992 RepID=UPI0018861A0D|nr:MaoC family dehydratase [Cumulibacter manganitolerans]